MSFQEFNDIESQVKPVLEASESGNESSEVYFLREKWKSTLEEWDGIQKDADVGICSISPGDLGSLIVAKYPTDARRRDERRQMAGRIQQRDQTSRRHDGFARKDSQSISPIRLGCQSTERTLEFFDDFRLESTTCKYERK